MTLAIQIEELSKLYRIGNIGTGTISHDLNRWWHLARGKEDPYAKIGQINDRTNPTESFTQENGTTKHNKHKTRPNNYVWALKNINLQVEQGEILGIIGRNGAGKSTLLKLLSRITSPSSGSIKTRGRIASLLEVGTGFHPELTGRENIFMNGAILGMRKHEIARQLDDIVSFSGCSKYIDTPVKRYSSGMSVRLGFAVAAHLECEILIVDEVLAVGDVEFQEKCMGRMKQISKKGRTVLFVSHNLRSIRELTSRSIVLTNGTLTYNSESGRAIDEYLTNIYPTNDSEAFSLQPRANETKIRSIRILNLKNFEIDCGSEMNLSVEIQSHIDSPSLCLSIGIHDNEQRRICHFWSYNFSRETGGKAGIYELKCTIPKFRLFGGKYSISAYLADRRSNELLHHIESACNFRVSIQNLHRECYPYTADECVYLETAEWKIQNFNPQNTNAAI